MDTKVEGIAAAGKFMPHPLVRFGPVQTYLAQLRPRGLRTGCDGDAPLILDAGPDYSAAAEDQRARLFGYFDGTTAVGGKKGLVVLLHGWEGCSHSIYNLILCQELNAQGYDVFRLNLRDHGPAFHLVPQALNKGMFLATLIEEVECALSTVARAAAPLPVFIIGMSMGGNFALRLAARQPEAASPGAMIPNLRHVIAISPAVNPRRSVVRIDRRPNLLRFFRNNWLQSLRTKEKLFPGLYEFQNLYQIPTIRGMTEWLVRRYSHFPNANSYFAEYTVTAHTVADLKVPTTIISACDDPVVPCVDLYALSPLPKLDVQLFAHGGHVGFVDILPFHHKLPGFVYRVLEQYF